VLKAHVNDALQRALRPGDYVQSVHFLGGVTAGQRSAILVLSTDPLAEAALALHDNLLCQGHRLSLRRPQGWGVEHQRAVDALPVVTLRGETHTSRMGASLLNAIGRSDCVTVTDEDFGVTAAAMAGDTEALTQWRLSSRELLGASPLLAHASTTRDFESLLQKAWLDSATRHPA
jgi:hypothetical protein